MPQLTAAVIERAPQLSAIGCFCIGTNPVEVALPEPSELTDA